MPTTVLADRDRATRRHYVTTVLAERLFDRPPGTSDSWAEA